MDENQFDKVIANLAKTPKRRDAIKGLLAGALGSLGLAAAADAKKGDGKNNKAKAQGKDNKAKAQGKDNKVKAQGKDNKVKAQGKDNKVKAQTCRTRPPLGSNQDNGCLCRGNGNCTSGNCCATAGGESGVCCAVACVNGACPSVPTTTTTTTTQAPNCGTDTCRQGETCIGGGGAQFPQVCCPNNRVCGGPAANVQICCVAGTRCQGDIPNQQCVPVTTTTTQAVTTTTQAVTTTTPQVGICSGDCNTNNANQCSNRGGAFCFCQPLNGVSGPGFCTIPSGGGGGACLQPLNGCNNNNALCSGGCICQGNICVPGNTGACPQPVGGCNGNNALCSAGCVCQGNTCVAGGTGGSNCAACNNQTCRTGVLGDCNAACTCQAVSTGTTSAPGAFNGICVPGPICLTTTTARPGTTTPPVTPPPGQLTECGPGTANPCENGCCSLNTAGFFTCEDGGAKGACGKGGRVCIKCGGRKKCSVNKGTCKKIKTKGASI